MKITQTTLNIIFLFILLTSCNEKDSLPNIKFDNLYKVKSIKVSKKASTLDIKILDDSFIYFEDYNDLKFDVLIDNNFETLKKFDSLNITATQMDRDDIYSKAYTKNDLKEIKNKFSNKYLKRNLYLVVNSFSLSEIWNFRSTSIQFSDHKKYKKELNYIELLAWHSEFQNGKRKDSIATKRIELMKNFFDEEGMQDSWSESDKRIDASNLVLNLNLILSK